MNIKTKWMLSLLSLSGFVSCAPTAGVNTSIQRQANVSSTQGLNERLAILDIRGNSGEQMANTLTGALASHQVNGKPYFTLVDRANLDKLMGEVARSQSGLIDENSAVQIGKLSGAKAILTGSYDSRYDDSNYQETRFAKSGNYQVYCTKRIITATFNPRIIDTNTGQIVYSRQLSQQSTSSKCSDENYRELDVPALVAPRLANSISRDLIDDLAPHTVVLRIAFIDDPKAIKTDSAKALFSQAMTWAKNDRLDRACPLWLSANDAEPENPIIIYHLGVCAESQGDISGAAALYGKADQLLTAPNATITAALRRINEKQGGAQVQPTGSNVISDALNSLLRMFGK